MPFTLFVDNALTTLSGLTILQVAFYSAFLCLLASAGGIFNSFFDITWGFFSKKNIVVKYASQSCFAAFALFLLFCATTGSLMLLNPGANPAALLAPYITPVLPLSALLFACVLVLTALSKKFSGNFLLCLMTLITTLLFIAQIAWWQAQSYAPFRALAYNENMVSVWERSVVSFNYTDHASFMVVGIYLLAAAFTFGSIIMMPWLIMRRNRDDYGRDYYTFAMRRAARRALFCLLPTTAVACYSNWVLYATLAESFCLAYGALLALSVLLLVLLAFFLINISVSATPMRCKPSAIAAFFLYALIVMMQFIIMDFSPGIL